MMGWGCPGFGISGGWGSIGLLGMLPGLLTFGGFLIVIVVGIILITRQLPSSRGSTGIHRD
jgi:hypothetical protein